MKRILSMLLALTMLFALVSCGNNNQPSNNGGNQNTNQTDDNNTTDDNTTTDDWHIGIITGTVSQSEDDLRGAEAIQAKYGAEKVKLATYPDNFTEELET